MAHQITLSDEEYEALSVVAAQRGQPVETLVHEALAERYAVPRPAGDRRRIDPLVAYMARQGHVRGIPTEDADTPEIRAARERLARSVMPGMSASDMVLEDRGPR